MIISASYKTDIPTFYGEWFMNRLRAGHCKMVNPYSQQPYPVNLSPEAVDGFVFWTKNIGPFLKHLPEIQQRGYPFIVQHTINGYPPKFEYRVINYLHTIEHMKKLSVEYGPDVAIWRYDPIIISSLTSLDWHRQKFEMIAKSLAGTTDEVVISFAQVYKKTKRNMDLAAQEKPGFQWDEHEAISQDIVKGLIPVTVKGLISELALIAQSYGMKLKVCSQKNLLIPGVVEEARCVDADRLEKVSNKSILDKTRQKGNRKECGCFASRDIGEYDTCPHGCIYCYAVQNRNLALMRFKEHDPTSEFLFPPKEINREVNEQTIIPVSNVINKTGYTKITQRELF